MDYRCQDCGEDEVVNIQTFGDPSPRFMCAVCGSKRIVRYSKTHGTAPTASRLVHRLRQAEKNLPPSPMERAITRQHWEQQAEGMRNDLVALLAELDPK